MVGKAPEPGLDMQEVFVQSQWDRLMACLQQGARRYGCRSPSSTADSSPCGSMRKEPRTGRSGPATVSFPRALFSPAQRGRRLWRRDAEDAVSVPQMLYLNSVSSNRRKAASAEI